MQLDEVEGAVEEFVRRNFAVAQADPRFSRDALLFEMGYVDSVGVVELLEFVSDTWQVRIPDSDLLADGFSSIRGIAAVVVRLRGDRRDNPLAPTLWAEL